jgi:hypothetical protein
MFLYNITYKVDNNIANEWIQWQKEIHIPAILQPGLFYKHRFYELLEQNDSEGRTFVIQFLSKAREDYDQYIIHHSKKFRDDAMNKWGNQFIAFRTLLQAVI